MSRTFRNLAFFAAALAALASAPVRAGAETSESAGAIASQNAGAIVAGTYHLDVGDKVKVTVYGEDDLSGEFQVDGVGNVGMPMIGEVHAAGMTTADFSAAVQQKLVSGGFLINPRVSADVTNYRPFTIIGEVNKPGEYPYENGMTVLNAVALAGGWTYRAEQNTVYIQHKGSDHKEPAAANDKTVVDPGDTIIVSERIF
jgi:protein involved in polysaccharide export with SLBB domain